MNDRFREILGKVEADGDVKVRSYSGRGMYGAKCLAVEVEAGYSPLLLGALIMYHADGLDEQEDLVEILGTTFQDNMGRGMVYYWPKQGV